LSPFAELKPGVDKPSFACSERPASAVLIHLAGFREASVDFVP